MQLDDKTQFYYCHVEREESLHVIIFFDEGWRCIGNTLPGGRAPQGCGPPSAWKDVYKNIGPNYSVVPFVSYCAECNEGLRITDYLCDACRDRS